MGVVIIVASKRDQRPHWPLPEVYTCCKHHKVSDNDVPTRSISVKNIRGGVGSAMHGTRGVIPFMTTKTDAMPRMRHGTDLWVNDRTSDANA